MNTAPTPYFAHPPSRRLLLALVVFALTSWSTVTMGRADDRSHTMHVSGTGSVELIPDRALIPMGINARGDDIPELQRETDTRVAELLSVFRELGLPDADMQATDLRIAPRYRYDKSLQQSVPDGFEVSRELRITLRDLSLLGRVMTAATGAGVNNISPPQLSSSIHEEKYREALTLAVSQARERAQVLTGAASVNLGPVITMAVQGGRPRPEPMAMTMRAVAADEAGGGYQAGEMTITATVHVEFALLP